MPPRVARTSEPIPFSFFFCNQLLYTCSLFREERAQWRAHLASFLCGGSFAGGLVLSGMVKRAKVVDFLALR